MTVDAAMLCCCGGTGTPVSCCPLTSVVMKVSGSLNFDYQWLDLATGTSMRRFTAAEIQNNVYVPGPISLTPGMTEPIVLQRFPSNTVDAAGQHGRCGYGAIRFFSGTLFPPLDGWSFNVVTIPAGMTPSILNVSQFGSIQSGRVVPIVSGGPQPLSGTAHYYIRAFRQEAYGEPPGAYGFEAGLMCGNIHVGLVRQWPLNGCPPGTAWTTGNYFGHNNYYRGMVRFGPAPSFTQLFGSQTPPMNHTEQTILNLKAKLTVDAFEIEVL